jgi:hypothetical protein
MTDQEFKEMRFMIQRRAREVRPQECLWSRRGEPRSLRKNGIEGGTDDQARSLINESLGPHVLGQN